jgi:eukaryotic-like serine/threonine-protein kinase
MASEGLHAPDELLAPGTMVGEYRIDRRIGGGAMGMVYAATQPIIEKRAAVKVLRREVCRRPAAIDRFIDEARATNRICHPNIVDIFSFGRLGDGTPYFVMELLEGESLRACMERGELDADEKIDILLDVCRALEATHEKSIVHRDLKPDNIFLARRDRERPTVKLLDFGIAKLSSATGEQIHRTRDGVVGTPLYIAPEQACGYAVDGRTDVYALGVIAYELFVERPPFLGDESAEVMYMQVHEAPPTPSSLSAGLPVALERLLLLMLAKDPGRRPSLVEVRATLSAVRTVFTRVVEPQVPTEPMERYIGDALPFVAAAPRPTLEPELPRHSRRGLWLALVAGGAAALLPLALLRRVPSPAPAFVPRPAIAKPAVVAASPAPPLSPPSIMTPAPPAAHALRRPSATARRPAKPRSAPAPALDDAAVDPFASER